jgi:hypothetical protein
MIPAQAGVSLNLPQDYLEVARAAAAILGPPGSPLAGPHRHPGLHNAVFTVLTMELLYSYLAVEAFLARAESEAGLETREAGLAPRLDSLCAAWRALPIAEAEPGLEADLRVLDRDAGMLLPRGNASNCERESAIRDLLAGSSTERYANVAERTLRHLLKLRGARQPDWLTRNVLLDLRASLVQ